MRYIGLRSSARKALSSKMQPPDYQTCKKQDCIEEKLKHLAY
jgi:hypothetical protein